ncbi:OmpA family protein [Methylomonas sp. AM2-LC]|uniref:OmpA family protein n=1 Tax=Methylomonas sp. AM2-LC TaxID=3153301 RepID=UPI0032664341
MLKNKLLPIALLLSSLMLPTAHAAGTSIDDNRWYIAPFGTYVHTGGDRNADDGWGGGMGFGKIIDRHFNVELEGFYQGFNGQNGAWSMSGGTADVQYFFFRDKFSPYTVLGAGAMNTCLSGKCGGGFIGEAGVGFTYELMDNLLFRSDVRYRYNNNLNANVQSGTNEFNDMVVNVGFVIPFGPKPVSAPIKVDAPAPVVTSARSTPVADCSTLDSDGDGVNNCLDKCSDTPKNSKVDVNGCPIKLILKGSNFKVDSAELTVPAKAILDEVAHSLNNYPLKNDIDVQGHTSSEGGVAHNQKLSERRAKSVADYLKSKGVTNRLFVKGFGKNKPIADNRTEEGRSENRRVELIWIEN